MTSDLASRSDEQLPCPPPVRPCLPAPDWAQVIACARAVAGGCRGTGDRRLPAHPCLIGYRQTGPDQARAGAGTGWTRELVILLDRLIYSMAKHWVWTVNGIVALYTVLPLLAPLLMAIGWGAPARVIYFMYSFLCHQIPERSFFVLGYKMAFCQRCTAIYSSVLLGGMLFPIARRWLDLKPPRWRLYILLIAPMALDGLTQFIGLRGSTPFWRVLTGSLFGLSSVWLCYPYLEQGFADIRTEIEEKLGLGG